MCNTEELKAEYKKIEDALWDIERAAQYAGVSQFSSYLQRLTFIKKYARKLHDKLRVRQKRGWSAKRIGKLAQRWDVANGVAAIQRAAEKKQAKG